MYKEWYQVFEFDSIIFVELVTLVIPTLLATKMF